MAFTIQQSEADRVASAGERLPIGAVVVPNPSEKITKLYNQIIDQGTTSRWKGQGFGSPNDNALAIAKMLASVDINDIKDFGKFEVFDRVDQYTGNPIDPKDLSKGFTISETIQNENGDIVATGRQIPAPKDVTVIPHDFLDYSSTIDDYSPRTYTPGYLIQYPVYKEVFGNKTTKTELPPSYSLASGNIFGGTFAGKDSTGFGVQFSPDGTPYFFTQQGPSTSSAGEFLPIASFAMSIFAPGIGGAIGAALTGTAATTIISQVVGNAIVQGTMAELSGGNFEDGAIRGAVGAGVAPLVAGTVGKAVADAMGNSEYAKVVTNAVTSASSAALSTAILGGDVGDAALNAAVTSVGSTVGRELGGDTGARLGVAASKVALGQDVDKVIASTLMDTITSTVRNALKEDPLLAASSKQIGQGEIDAIKKHTDDAAKNLNVAGTGDAATDQELADIVASGTPDIEKGFYANLNKDSGPIDFDTGLPIEDDVASNQEVADIVASIGSVDNKISRGFGENVAGPYRVEVSLPVSKERLPDNFPIPDGYRALNQSELDNNSLNILRQGGLDARLSDSVDGIEAVLVPDSVGKITVEDGIIFVEPSVDLDAASIPGLGDVQQILTDNQPSLGNAETQLGASSAEVEQGEQQAIDDALKAEDQETQNDLEKAIKDSAGTITEQEIADIVAGSVTAPPALPQPPVVPPEPPPETEQEKSDRKEAEAIMAGFPDAATMERYGNDIYKYNTDIEDEKEAKRLADETKDFDIKDAKRIADESEAADARLYGFSNVEDYRKALADERAFVAEYVAPVDKIDDPVYTPPVIDAPVIKADADAIDNGPLVDLNDMDGEKATDKEILDVVAGTTGGGDTVPGDLDTVPGGATDEKGVATADTLGGGDIRDPFTILTPTDGENRGDVESVVIDDIDDGAATDTAVPSDATTEIRDPFTILTPTEVDDRGGVESVIVGDDSLTGGDDALDDLLELTPTDGENRGDVESVVVDDPLDGLLELTPTDGDDRGAVENVQVGDDRGAVENVVIDDVEPEPPPAPPPEPPPEPPEPVVCGPGFHDDGTGFCVPDEDEPETDECPVGQVRNLATGLCETPPPPPPPPTPPVVSPPVVKQPPKRNPALDAYIAQAVASIGSSGAEDKTGPFYARMGEYMDISDPFTVKPLTSNADKQNALKQQQMNKMAVGGFIDALQAEEMTVDDLLNFLQQRN